MTKLDKTAFTDELIRVTEVQLLAQGQKINRNLVNSQVSTRD